MLLLLFLVIQILVLVVKDRLSLGILGVAARAVVVVDGKHDVAVAGQVSAHDADAGARATQVVGHHDWDQRTAVDLEVPGKTALIYDVHLNVNELSEEVKRKGHQKLVVFSVQLVRPEVGSSQAT